jgi:hypothetical protein
VGEGLMMVYFKFIKESWILKGNRIEIILPAHTPDTQLAIKQSVELAHFPPISLAIYYTKIFLISKLNIY